MNVTAWCIRNDRTSYFTFALIALLGVTSYLTMPRLENPEFVVRMAMVTTVFPGAAPDKVEALVTDPLEKKLRSMAEVKKVSSQSLSGVSIILVEIEERYKDMAPIWQRLRNKVSDAAAGLPDGVMTPTVNDEFGDVFGIVVALTGDGYTYREMKDTADDLRDILLSVKDVAKVDLHGIQDERVFVEFSNARLAAYGLSPAMLADVLASQNIIQPGGSAKVGPDRVIIEPTGEFKSVEQIRKTALRLPGYPESLYLEDVAEVRRGFVDPPESMARAAGQPAIILAVSMAKSGRITELGPRVTAAIETFTTTLPLGLDFHALAYQPRFVDRSIHDFMINLLQSFCFVFVIVLVFTGLRTGLVVGALVPMAMLACLMLMPRFGINLQKMSIASLIVSLGMLVDNGVVVGEDILVRMSRGVERFKACTASAASLTVPMLSASLSTVFAFLPIATAKSNTGEYTFSLFVVVTLTLLSSWVLALTMIPLLSYHVLRPRRVAQVFSGLLYRAFRGALLINLRHRGVSTLAVIGLTVLAVWGFRFVPKTFFPPNAREMFYIDLYLPYGSDIRTTAGRAAELEKHLFSLGAVAQIGTTIGNPGARWYLSLPMEDRGTHYARMVITTNTPGDVAGVAKMAKAFMDREFPEVRPVVTLLENGPPVGAPIQIRISGPDIRAIYDLRETVMAEMRNVPGVVNIRDDWGEWTKKMRIYVDQNQAKAAGFTSQDIALSLLTQYSGLPATQYREGKEVIPVILRSKDAYREDLGRIEDLNVYSWRDGTSVPLLQVGRAKLKWQVSNIRRENGIRTMTIKADVSGRYAREVTGDIAARLSARARSGGWPTGYRISYGGEDEKSSEAQHSIAVGLPLAGGLILLLLVLQFNSMRRMIIIILTIPPTMVGITFGLLASEAPFGFMAMLGMISLTGIVMNNAIILIDSIEYDRGRGLDPRHAVVLSAQQRLRPIVMTAMTTIAGLMPLALSGDEMWRPMANTLIFGLAFGTALTLVLCPVLYSLFFGLRYKDYRWDPSVIEGNEA